MDDFIARGEYDERMKRLDDENARQNHRLSELEKTADVLRELTASVREFAVSLTNMQHELERQGTRLDRIESQPADNWRAVVKTVITVIVTALVTYYIAR